MQVNRITSRSQVTLGNAILVKAPPTFPNLMIDSEMKTNKKFLIILAIIGNVLAMVLAMSASSFAGTGKSFFSTEADKTIILNEKGIYAFQREMSAAGYRVKVIDGVSSIYMVDNSIMTVLTVKTAERKVAHYTVLHQFSPTELWLIMRDSDEDPNEPTYIPRKVFPWIGPLIKGPVRTEP
jgi:hypothetical protein